MRRKSEKPWRRPGGLVGERIAWIDRLVRAIDIQPGPPVALVRECAEIRAALNTFRDGLVLGSRLAETQKKLK